MKLYKKCSCCKAIKRLSEFNRSRAEKDGLKSYCRDCSKKQQAKYKRRYSEPKNITKATRQAVMLGRPGCIVRDGVAHVLYKDREEWVEMPVKLCEICGIDQHLDICLDCSAPVGLNTSQGIRPLYRCEDCNEWRSYKSGCKC
tara:strand:- start:227 stop:655 length:429 start_codon:yes stop_codon:yes gene_type:complete